MSVKTRVHQILWVSVTSYPMVSPSQSSLWLCARHCTFSPCFCWSVFMTRPDSRRFFVQEQSLVLLFSTSAVLVIFCVICPFEDTPPFRDTIASIEFVRCLLIWHLHGAAFLPRCWQLFILFCFVSALESFLHTDRDRTRLHWFALANA